MKKKILWLGMLFLLLINLSSCWIDGPGYYGGGGYYGGYYGSHYRGHHHHYHGHGHHYGHYR